MKHLNISVNGLVQGVGFRSESAAMARKLNLAGFVKNFPDGSAYIEVEGEEEKLQDFLEWIKTGFAFPGDHQVHQEEGKVEKFKEFSIEP